MSTSAESKLSFLFSKLSYSSVEGHALMKVASMSAVVTSWNNTRSLFLEYTCSASLNEIRHILFSIGKFK